MVASFTHDQHHVAIRKAERVEANEELAHPELYRIGVWPSAALLIRAEFRIFRNIGTTREVSENHGNLRASLFRLVFHQDFANFCFFPCQYSSTWSKSGHRILLGQSLTTRQPF